MTKLINGELKDLLPEPLSSDPDVIAISYALKMAMKKCLEYSVGTRMYADIDNMTEDILDYMAVEMRLVYYDESFSIDVKRSLIKESYFSYMEAGTKNAVERLIEQIYGLGDVTEWFDFPDGEGIPGEFDITTDAQLTPETFEMISKTIESVKNESSHLRRIQTAREIDGNLYLGTGVIASPRYVVTQLISDQADINGNALGAAANTGTPRVIII